jgi:hypothetical protein
VSERDDVRRARVQEAIAEALTDLAVDVCGGESARALRTIELVAAAGQRLCAALDGVALPSAGAGAIAVEPADSQGAYAGLAGGVAQVAENHGQRVVAEMVALGRTWMEQKNRPKLGDLLGAYYQARGAGDAVGAEALRAKLAADHGVDVGVPAKTDADAVFEEALTPEPKIRGYAAMPGHPAPTKEPA